MAHIRAKACSRRADTRCRRSSVRSMASRSKSFTRRLIWRFSNRLRRSSESDSARYISFCSRRAANTSSRNCRMSRTWRVFGTTRTVLAPCVPSFPSFPFFFLGLNQFQKLFLLFFSLSCTGALTTRSGTEADCSSGGNRSLSRLSMRLAVEGVSARRRIWVFFSASSSRTVSMRLCCRESG